MNVVKKKQMERVQDYQDEVRAIERRGRIEREIELLQQEAENIRNTEEMMVRRVE